MTIKEMFFTRQAQTYISYVYSQSWFHLAHNPLHIPLVVYSALRDNIVNFGGGGGMTINSIIQ